MPSGNGPAGFHFTLTVGEDSKMPCHGGKKGGKKGGKR